MCSRDAGGRDAVQTRGIVGRAGFVAPFGLVTLRLMLGLAFASRSDRRPIEDEAHPPPSPGAGAVLGEQTLFRAAAALEGDLGLDLRPPLLTGV